MKGQTERMPEQTGARTPAEPRIYDSILETVGRTPLVRLHAIAHEPSMAKGLA